MNTQETEEGDGVSPTVGAGEGLVAAPPSYAEASAQPGLLHPFELSHRFPPGLFILRNRSCLKLLDVAAASILPGAPVIAYTPKRPTFLNGDLFHKENNQLFFIDWHGCLCSARSGLRGDVEDYKPVLARPQPMGRQATRASHPPVEFKYDTLTRTIGVEFHHDPSYTEGGLRKEGVGGVEYLLEVVPEAKGGGRNGGGFGLEKLTEWLPIPRPGPGWVEEFGGGGCSVVPGWREKFRSSESPEADVWLGERQCS